MNKESAPAIFDPDEAAGRIGGDHELLQSLVEMYLAEHGSYLSSLETPFVAEDWAAFARGVHTLKGVLATLSANRAHAVAERLDLAAKAGEVERYAALLTELKGELAVLLDTFRKR